MHSGLSKPAQAGAVHMTGSLGSRETVWHWMCSLQSQFDHIWGPYFWFISSCFSVVALFLFNFFDWNQQSTLWVSIEEENQRGSVMAFSLL